MRKFEDIADHEGLQPLLRSFEEFRQTSLKYLMFKDWEEFEKFMEEIEASKTREALRFALHKFRIFMEALVRRSQQASGSATSFSQLSRRKG